MTTGFRHRLLGMYITYNIGAAYKRQELAINHFYTNLNATYSQARLYLLPTLSYTSPVFKIVEG